MIVEQFSRSSDDRVSSEIEQWSHDSVRVAAVMRRDELSLPVRGRLCIKLPMLYIRL